MGRIPQLLLVPSGISAKEWQIIIEHTINVPKLTEHIIISVSTSKCAFGTKTLNSFWWRWDFAIISGSLLGYYGSEIIRFFCPQLIAEVLVVNA